MFSRIRNSVTYTNVVVTLALVFAMTGGAYAAKHYLINSTNQINPKVLKALEGMAGKAGATGSQGPPGTAGPQGPAGLKGEPGTPGAAGKTGKSGKEGREGKEGEAGAEGSPWTAGGTLPPGASETGTWSLSEVTKAGTVFIPISFTIPLKAPLPAEKVKIFEGETPPEGCKGSKVENGVVTDLKAESGYLCVYARFFPNLSAATELIPLNSDTIEPPGAGRHGLVLFSPGLKEGASGFGTWAVTEATG